MALFEVKKKEMAAYQSSPLEDLTIQDGFIISAIYAVEADTRRCEQIKSLAQHQALFEEKPKDTSARVNKFANLMQGGNSLKAVEATARKLKPEQRKQAFEFAIQAARADGPLTEKTKHSLQTLAHKLALDQEFVDRKLATARNKNS